MNCYHTRCFTEEFIGYCVVESDEQMLYHMNKLLDFNIYQCVRTLDNDLVVPLKYDLNDIIEEHLLGTNPLHF